MTEPTNPLFEDEKDFLERKKLEYERALRGDVEEIKENTVQAGKVALIGAGVVGGIWLLSKAFGGGKAKKKKHKKHRQAFEDYAGFDGFDEYDQELNELDNDFQAPDDSYYPATGYVDADESSDGFAYAGGASASYQGETDEDDTEADDYDRYAAQPGTEGLHLAEDHGYDEREEPAHSLASSNSYQARPYDDSRRLPHSNSFLDEEAADEDYDHAPAAAEPAQSKRSLIVPTLLAFAKSETGRVLIAQAAAVGLAIVTKAVQGFAAHDEETTKNADLAGSSATVGASPATWPATSAAQDAADAHHDDKLAYREPLA